MPDDNELSARIALDIDKQSFAKAKRELFKAASDFEKAGKGNTDEFLKQNKAQADSLNKFKSAIDAREKELKLSKEQSKQEEKRNALAKDRLKALDEESSKIRRDVGGLGDVGSAGRTITGLGGALGANVSGLNAATEIFDTIEAVGQLKGALPLAKEGFKSLATSIGSNVGELTTVLGAAGIVFAGLSIAVSEFNRIAGEANVQIDAGIKGRARAADEIAGGATSTELGNSIGDLRTQITSDINQAAAVQEAINAIKDNKTLEGGIKELVAQFGGSLDLLEKERDRLEGRVAENLIFTDAVKQAINSGATAQNDAVKSAVDYNNTLSKNFALEQQINQFAKTATSETLDERLKGLADEKELISGQLKTLEPLITTSATARTQFELLSSRFNDITTETDLLNKSAKGVIEAHEKEIDAKKALEEQTKKASEIDKQKQATLQRLNTLQESANSTLADFNEQLSKTSTERFLRDQREIQDFQNKQAQDLSKHNSDLAKIQIDGDAKIADIQQSSVEDRNAFFDTEIKATTDYRNEVSKLNLEFNKQQQRDLEDHLKNLNSARQNNDVLSFLQELDSFKTQQKRNKEDKSETQKELEAQFQVERDLRRQEFETKQKGIQAEIDLARQQTQQKLAESASAFQQDQAQENAARELKLSRQKQDDAIADQYARQALQKRLDAINAEAQAQIVAINKVAQATQNLVAIANRIATATNNTSSTRNPNSTVYGGSTPIGSKSYEGGTTRIHATAFADGGVSTSPTLSLTGEKRGYGDAIIPFKLSEGIMPALRRAGGSSAHVINLNINNPSIGDIANMKDVENYGEFLVEYIKNEIGDGLVMAQNNPKVAG